MGSEKADWDAFAIALAQQYRGFREGDYVGDDGLLRCSQCHTPKEAFVNFPNRPDFKAPISCQCQQEHEKERREQSQIARVERIAQNHWSEQARWFCQDNLHSPKASTACREYVCNWDAMYRENVGILFYGPVETGKTFLATCIASELLKRGVPTFVTNVTTIIDRMSAFDNSDYVHDLCKWHLLVIDDIGASRDTSTANERLYSAINARVACGKPMIVTTNLAIDKMVDPNNVTMQRIYSRVKGACQIPLLLDGESQRERVFKEKQGLARRLLFGRGNKSGDRNG